MSLLPKELVMVDKTLVYLDEKGEAVSINLPELTYNLYRRVNQLENLVAELQYGHIETPRSARNDEERYEAVQKTLDAVINELGKMRNIESKRREVSKIPTLNKKPFK